MSRRNRSTGPPVSFFSFQDIITSVTGILILVTLLMALDLVVRVDAKSTASAEADVAPIFQLAESREKEIDLARSQVTATQQLLDRLGSISPLAASTQGAQIRAQLPVLRDDVDKTRLACKEVEGANEAARQKLLKLHAAATDARKKAQEVSDQTKALAASGKLVVLPGEGSAKRPIVIDCSEKLVEACLLNHDGSTVSLGKWRSDLAIEKILLLAKQRDSGADYFVLFVRPGAIDTYESLVIELRAAGFDVGWDAVSQDAKMFDEKR